MSPRDHAPARIAIPPFVALRTSPWARGGASFGTYLSALVDLPSLDNARVLCVSGTADMLHGLAEGAWNVQHCTAIEPDPVVAAFFWTASPPEADIRPTTLDAAVDELRALDPFDVVVVRIDPSELTADHLSTTLATVGSVAADDAALVLSIALAEPTVSGRSAADRLADRGELEGIGPYTEYEWELGMMPLYRRDRLAELVTEHGWTLAEVREPHRSWHQHHVLLRRAEPPAS